MRGFDGEVGGFPAGDAAGDFADGGEAGALEEAGGDGGTVASGAVEQQRTVLRQLRDALREVVQRNGHAAGDIFLLAFARTTNVHGERRVRGGEHFGGVGSAETFGEGNQVR